LQEPRVVVVVGVPPHLPTGLVGLESR
jgi:hypothetical protein